MQSRYFYSLSSNSPEMNTLKLCHFVKKGKKKIKKKFLKKSLFLSSNLSSQDRCSLQTQQINIVKKSNQTW